MLQPTSVPTPLEEEKNERQKTERTIHLTQLQIPFPHARKGQLGQVHTYSYLQHWLDVALVEDVLPLLPGIPGS